jgi:hypothetical protein
MSKREYDIAQQTEEPQNGEVIFWVKGTESATDVINGVAPTINTVFDSTAGTIDTTMGVYCANNTRYNAALKYDMSGTAYPNKLLNASRVLVEFTVTPTYFKAGASTTNGDNYTSISLGQTKNTSDVLIETNFGPYIAYSRFLLNNESTGYIEFHINNGVVDYQKRYNAQDNNFSESTSSVTINENISNNIWFSSKKWSGPGAFKGYLKEFKITVW